MKAGRDWKIQVKAEDCMTTIDNLHSDRRAEQLASSKTVKFLIVQQSHMYMTDSPDVKA